MEAFGSKKERRLVHIKTFTGLHLCLCTLTNRIFDGVRSAEENDRTKASIKGSQQMRLAKPNGREIFIILMLSSIFTSIINSQRHTQIIKFFSLFMFNFQFPHSLSMFQSFLFYLLFNFHLSIINECTLLPVTQQSRMRMLIQHSTFCSSSLSIREFGFPSQHVSLSSFASIW